MENAIGEKFGDILRSLGLVFSGFAIAFSRGWSFSLVMLAMMPFISVSGALFAGTIATGFKASLKAYAQSAGYAE